MNDSNEHNIFILWPNMDRDSRDTILKSLYVQRAEFSENIGIKNLFHKDRLELFMIRSLLGYFSDMQLKILHLLSASEELRKMYSTLLSITVVIDNEWNNKILDMKINDLWTDIFMSNKNFKKTSQKFINFREKLVKEFNKKFRRHKYLQDVVVKSELNFFSQSTLHGTSFINGWYGPGMNDFCSTLQEIIIYSYRFKYYQTVIKLRKRQANKDIVILVLSLLAILISIIAIYLQLS